MATFLQGSSSEISPLWHPTEAPRRSATPATPAPKTTRRSLEESRGSCRADGNARGTGGELEVTPGREAPWA
jgi:hypothetical protein